VRGGARLGKSAVLSKSTETIALNAKDINESNDSELDLASVNLCTNVADSSVNQVILKICKCKKANRQSAMLTTLKNQKSNPLTGVVKEKINKAAVANLPLTEHSLCLHGRRCHYEHTLARTVTRSKPSQGVKPENSLHSEKMVADFLRSEKCGAAIVEDFTYFNDSLEAEMAILESFEALSRRIGASSMQWPWVSTVLASSPALTVLLLLVCAYLTR